MKWGLQLVKFSFRVQILTKARERILLEIKVSVSKETVVCCVGWQVKHLEVDKGKLAGIVS